MSSVKRNTGLQFKILMALFCEDARKDEHGKDILVGVFSSNNIVVRSFPAKIWLGAWLNIEVEGAGEESIDIRFLGPRKKELITGKLRLQRQDEGHEIISLGTPSAMLTVDEPCSLRFQVKKPSGRWKDVISKEIVEAPKPDNVP